MAAPAYLRVLAALGAERELTQIAARIGAPYPTVYKAARNMERQGLLTSSKSHGTARVDPTSAALVDRATAVLRDVPRPDWDQILRGDRPMMLHVLNRVKTARLTSEVCQKSLSTVHHMIERLVAKGVLLRGEGRPPLDRHGRGRGATGGFQLEKGDRTDAGKYHVNQNLSSLIGFLDEMMHVQALSRLGAVRPEATLVWHLGPDLLFRGPGQAKGTRPGAFSAFADYGIEIYSPVPYWFVSKRTLTVADFILQTLLLRPGNPIHRSYAALLLERTLQDNASWVVDEIREKTAIYDDGNGELATLAEALVEYVATGQGGAQFLPWSEQ